MATGKPDVVHMDTDKSEHRLGYLIYYYLLITPKQLSCRHKNDKSSEH